MAFRQYVGARYVPDLAGTYDSTRNYEPLSVVDDANGNSYTSKKYVPAGTPLTDREYWAFTGSMSGAILALQNRVTQVEYDLRDSNAKIDNMEPVVYGGFVNVLSLGVKNDGTEDCSNIVNANNDVPLYFPAGVYRFDSTLNLKHTIIGEGAPRNWRKNKFNGTIFDFTMTDASNAIVYTGELGGESVEIANICIQLSGTGNGIDLSTDNSLFYIHEIGIVNVKGCGIKAYPTEYASRYLKTFNVTIWGEYANPTPGTVGIDIGPNAIDSYLESSFIFGVQRPIVVNAGGVRITGGHVWGAGGTNSAEYYNGTIGIDVFGDLCRIEGMYIDSVQCLVHCGVNGKSPTIANCMSYWGNYQSLAGFNAPTLFSIAAANNGNIFVENLYVKMPFATWYKSNKPNNIVGVVIIDGYEDNTTFNFARAEKCDDKKSYKMQADATRGKCFELARIGYYSNVIVNIGAWSSLVSGRGPGNAVEYMKIGSGAPIYYKDNGSYLSIYSYISALSGVTPCYMVGLNENVVNPNINLINGEQIVYEAQADATGLTPATEKQYVNA